MQKIIISIVVVLFAAFAAYDIFLADDALVKRTVKTDGPNGGYQIVTMQADGSQLVAVSYTHLTLPTIYSV